MKAINFKKLLATKKKSWSPFHLLFKEGLLIKKKIFRKHTRNEETVPTS